MIDRILEVYDILRPAYNGELNNEETRKQITRDLLIHLGDEYDVKCDEENNSPEIMDLNCLVATVFYNRFFSEYNYTHLIFGGENAAKVGKMLDRIL